MGENTTTTFYLGKMLVDLGCLFLYFIQNQKAVATVFEEGMSLSSHISWEMSQL